MRAAHWIGGVLLALVAIDLLLGLALPGAAVVEQVAFAATIETFHYLLIWQLLQPPALVTWALLVGLLWTGRASWPLSWAVIREVLRGTAYVIVAVVVLFGVLKERQLALAVLAGLAVQAALLRRGRASPESSPQPLRIAFGAAVLLSAYQLFSANIPDPAWQALLHWIDAGPDQPAAALERLRGGLTLSLLGLDLLLAGLFLARGQRRPRAIGLCAGLAAFVAVRTLAGVPGDFATSLALAVAVLASVDLVLAAADDPVLTGPLLPPGCPHAAIIGLILATCCALCSVAERYFVAWDEPHPALQRLDSDPELVHPGIFRLAADRAGQNLLVVYRESGVVRHVARSRGSWDAIDLSELPGCSGEVCNAGTLENIVFAEGLDRFVLSLELEDPGGEEVATADILALIEPATGRVDRLLELPNLGWMSSLAWDPERSWVYVGYEASEQLLAYDVEAEAVVQQTTLQGVGDIQDLVVDLEASPPRLYSVPLHRAWGLHLSETLLPGLERGRKTFVGGAQERLAFDPQRRRLFASRFYASRIAVVDADAMRTLRPIPADFGARGLAVDPQRHLLLSSSMFGGQLRVWDYEEQRMLASIPVGAYVKEIVVSPSLGKAWFGSLCGLFELDLDALQLSGSSP